MSFCQTSAILKYQGFLKYQIGFPLFKVSEAWKFQMSSFCVSTGKTNSLKGHFSSCQAECKNESYLTQWHTKGFWNIKLVSHCSKPVSHENSKCLDFASVQVKHIVKKAKHQSFCHSVRNERKIPCFELCVKVCSLWSCAFLTLCSSERICAQKVLSLSYHAIVALSN